MQSITSASSQQNRINDKERAVLTGVCVCSRAAEESCLCPHIPVSPCPLRHGGDGAWVPLWLWLLLPRENANGSDLVQRGRRASEVWEM